MEENWLGKSFVWWKGVVEDREDPLFLGRCKVRIFGWHTERKEDMPTENLPWAVPSLPLDNGRSPVGPREGDWVWGFFLDGNEAQMPVMVGFTPGIPEDVVEYSSDKLKSMLVEHKLFFSVWLEKSTSFTHKKQPNSVLKKQKILKDKQMIEDFKNLDAFLDQKFGELGL